MVVLLDPRDARLDRDSLRAELKRRGIQTKRYFYPPAHAQTAYRTVGRTAGRLKVTEEVSARSLALPLYTHMSDGVMEEVVRALMELLG